MCCSSTRLISGTHPPFSLLSTHPTLTSPPDPFTRLSFPTHFPKSPSLIRVGSLRPKSAINDGFISSVVNMDMMSFYELLGISESGTMLEIKQAYKQLARMYHPDVSPPGRVEEYTQVFILVQEAYETLSDPRRRALYDRDLAKGLHLAFSARRRYQSDEPIEERSTWKNRWQSQLSELRRRSMNKDTRGNMSWGARMRRQRNESTDP